MPGNNKTSLIFSFGLYLLLFVIFYFFLPHSILYYTIIYISSSLLFLLLCILIFQYEIPYRQILILIAAGVIIRLFFISSLPIGSEDVYRYIWDGKVQAHGINPYKYAPGDSALNALHSDRLPALVGYPQMKTIYFALSQILFYLAYLIGGENIFGIKLLLLLFEIASIAFILLLLKKLKLPEKYVLFYALCPLPIIQFAVDAHVDALGITLIIMSLYFYFTEKKNLSFIFLGLSILIKPTLVLLIPILFLEEKNLLNRIKTVLIPAIVFVVLFIPYIISANPFEALMVFAKNWTFNGLVFDILDSFIKNNQHSRIVSGLMFVVVYFFILRSKKDVLTKLYFSMFFLLIFSPVVHPWYAAWLAFLIPFRPKWSGILFVGLISLTAYTVFVYQTTGDWHDYPFILALEYTPVIGYLIYEYYKQRRYGQAGLN